MKRILLLEDDETLNNGIVMALKRQDYHFSQGFTITEAKEMLKKENFDLLILDINLPDGSGFELCQYGVWRIWLFSYVLCLCVL